MRNVSQYRGIADGKIDVSEHGTSTSRTGARKRRQMGTSGRRKK